ncbi:MAG: ATP-binding cassette domain-containing protein, partial [Limisphaerales bacterium]
MSAILTATDLEVRHNELVVLDRASLAIEENGRVGMVGRNGCGKSTFLKIIAGQINPDAGEVVRRRDLVVGYLPQEFALDPNLTVEGNVRTGAKQVLDLIHEFESLPADSKKHAELEEHILRLDGWGIDRHIQTAMAHLSCPAADRQISTLSGGEKRRVALCRAIIAQPDLLILDEPTNHLDTESIEWLGEFLLNYRGAFLMVTHDRYVLDHAEVVRLSLRNGQGFGEPSAVMFRRSVFTAVGGYDPLFEHAADVDFNLRASQHGRSVYLRHAYLRRRWHDEGFTRTNFNTG